MNFPFESQPNEIVNSIVTLSSSSTPRPEVSNSIFAIGDLSGNRVLSSAGNVLGNTIVDIPTGTVAQSEGLPDEVLISDGSGNTIWGSLVTGILQPTVSNQLLISSGTPGNFVLGPSYTLFNLPTGELASAANNINNSLITLTNEFGATSRVEDSGVAFDSLIDTRFLFFDNGRIRSGEFVLPMSTNVPGNTAGTGLPGQILTSLGGGATSWATMLATQIGDILLQGTTGNRLVTSDNDNTGLLESAYVFPTFIDATTPSLEANQPLVMSAIVSNNQTFETIGYSLPDLATVNAANKRSSLVSADRSSNHGKKLCFY